MDFGLQWYKFQPPARWYNFAPPFTPEHIDWVKQTCIWKADILYDLTKNLSFSSVLEIGTGRGDVLNALKGFDKKTGVDVSEEALKQHKTIYPKHQLVKIDADEKLPFIDKQFDCVLLCIILPKNWAHD